MTFFDESSKSEDKPEFSPKRNSHKAQRTRRKTGDELKQYI